MAETDTSANNNSPAIDRAAVNDKSLDLLVEIADPYFELLKDKEFTRLYMTNVLEAIKYACREHKTEVVKLGAALEGKTVDEYVVNPFTLPLKLVSAIGLYSKISADLFTSAAQNSEGVSSGSASENTEAPEQPNIS